MDIADFADNGNFAFVVGIDYCFPHRYRYAAFKSGHPSGWMWTSELSEAETFRTKEAAERHVRGDMSGLVDGNENVKVLKVQMAVEPA